MPGVGVLPPRLAGGVDAAPPHPVADRRVAARTGARTQPIETLWRGRKALYPADPTVTDADVPDRTIHNAVRTLNEKRFPNPVAGQRSLASA